MRAQITPRLLTKDQAAAYVGVSRSTFDGTCRVRAISLGPDPRLTRYDVKDLDDWIDRKKGAAPVSAEDYWLGELDREPARGKRRARQRA